MQRTRTPPTYALRPARPKDFDFAWGLYRALMRPLTLELLGAWRDEGQRAVVRAGLASGDARVVSVGGTDVGWFQARERGGVVELLQIYVAPGWQGRGLGSALIGTLKRRSLPVELSVMRNNARARGLLHRAAAAGDVALVALLLSAGADPDVRDRDGRTPLMLALRKRPPPDPAPDPAPEVVRRLLDAGARTDLVDEGGSAASDFARATGRPSLAEALKRPDAP